MFRADEFIKAKVEELRGEVKGRVLAIVSGGVDSTTSAVLTYRAVGDRLKAVFIDTGFMREGEPEAVKEALRGILPLEVVDEKERFYSKLLGLSDAEEKRRAFRDVFYEAVFSLAEEHGCDYVVQGTIAPDVIETLGGIKTQHNVLDLYEPYHRRGLKVVEPLRPLYKDQVRIVARALGLPRAITERQPFPGPGLLVRCIGELTMEKLEAVRKATRIVEELLSPLAPSQYFAAVMEARLSERPDLERVLPGSSRVLEVEGVRATGVKGDVRAYGKVVVVEGGGELGWSQLSRIVVKDREVTHVLKHVAGGGGGLMVVVRAVDTEDFMTADVHPVPEAVLDEVARRVLDELGQVSMVCFDVTPKPPATIEFE